MGGELTRYLAQFALEAAVPASARLTARFQMLDALGCAAAGSVEPFVTAAGELTRAAGGAPESSSVLGDRLPAGASAFVNVLAARSQLFDDTHGDGGVHSGAACVFTALAMAERQGSTLGEALDAATIGNELAIRIALAAGPEHYNRGYHSTGTCVVFGTAAAASRILGVDLDEMHGSLGLAGDQSCGLRQYQIDGWSADSALHAANASRNGIQSALLAGAGVSRPMAILEGDLGFFPVIVDVRATQRQAAFVDLGANWEASDIGIKPYPGCRSTHVALTLMQELLSERFLSPDQIEAVCVEGPPEVRKQFDRPIPKMPLDAQFSVQYGIARVVVSSALVSADYQQNRLAEDRVVGLQRKIEVRSNEDLHGEETVISVTLTSGETLRRKGRYPKGAPQNPFSSDEIISKYQANSKQILGQRKTKLVRDWVIEADDSSPVPELFEIFRD